MAPNLATLLFAIGVIGFFLLDRDQSVRTSKGLWIPVIWVLIAGSRPVSSWLGGGPASEGLKNADQYLEGNPMDRFIFSGLLLVGLVILARRKGLVGKILQRNPVITLFFTYCLISCLWSDYPDVSFKRWVKALSDFVMVLIVLTEADPLVATKRLLARVGFILVPASVLLIKYYPALGRVYNIWTWTPSYVGVADHKNTLGMIVMILAIGFLWRFLLAYRDREDPKRRNRLLVHGTLIGMSIWLFTQAQSMTGQATFAIAAVFLIATSLAFVIRKRSLVQLLVLVLVAAPACTLLLGIGGGALEEMGKDATLTGRTDIWKLVLNMAGNPFFGTGFESFWLGSRANRMWAMYYFHPTQAHNGYLEVYLELGWIGIVLLAAIIFAGYRNALALLRSNPEAGRIRMTFIAVALVYNVTEAGFRMMTLTWIFLLLSATVVPGLAMETASDTLPEDTAPNFDTWQHPRQPVSDFARR
ncbi:MAG: O-antigen ligase family protein [Candidatus Acidiferrales bacterium]|jgi:O-antigen ligase